MIYAYSLFHTSLYHKSIILSHSSLSVPKCPNRVATFCPTQDKSFDRRLLSCFFLHWSAHLKCPYLLILIALIWKKPWITLKLEILVRVTSVTFEQLQLAHHSTLILSYRMPLVGVHQHLLILSLLQFLIDARCAFSQYCL